MVPVVVSIAGLACSERFVMVGAIPSHGVRISDGVRIGSDPKGISVAAGATGGFLPMGLEYSLIEVQGGCTHSLLLRWDLTTVVGKRNHYSVIEPYLSSHLGFLLPRRDGGSSPWGVVVYGARLGLLLRPFARVRANRAKPQLFAEVGASPAVGSDGDDVGALIEWRAIVGLRIGWSMKVYPFPPRWAPGETH
jgi:hypothetical protein